MHAQTSSIFYSFLFVFILSCSSSVESDVNESQKQQASDEFISYKLQEVERKGKWSDIIKEIEITRLEETDQTLLSYVFNLHMVGDQVVFSSGDDSDIYTFSKSGEFIQKMNRKGEGPEEYESIQGLWMEGETVAIYSRGKYIKRYSLEGDFISSENIDYRAGYILKYAKGYALDMYFATVDDSLFYNVVTLDPQMKRNEVLLPMKQPEGFSIRTSNSTLTDYKTSFLYQRIMSDTVYLKTENGMEPMIHFDFGSNWFWNSNDAKSNILDKMFQSELTWNQVSNVSPNYAYVSGMGGKGSGDTYLIDRTTNKMIKIVYSSVEEEKYFLRISNLTDEGIIGSMSSLEVATLLNELEDSQWSFTEGTTLEEIESSENPVLVRVKLKDSSEW